MLEPALLEHVKAGRVPLGRLGGSTSIAGSWGRWQPAWQWLERGSTDGAYLANQAAGPLLELGKFAEAEPLCRTALRSSSRASARTTPTSPPRFNNLAVVAAGHQPAGRGRAAHPPGARRSIERGRGPGPPRVAAASTTWRGCWVTEPAGRGRAALSPRAGDRRADLGPDHPNVAIRLNNLAGLLRPPTGRARPSRSSAGLAIDEQLGPGPPQSPSPQQPGGVAQDTGRSVEAEPLFRRAWRSGAEPRPGPPTGRHPSTTWRSCFGPPTGWPRPSRSTAAPWRSASGVSARTTRLWPRR